MTAAPTVARPLRLLMAPLVLVERARGRRRLALLVLYGLILLAAGALVWRATSLNGLPDGGDPFDVAAFEAARRVPEAEDATPLYRRAFGRLVESPQASHHNLMWTASRAGWAKASPAIRAWVEVNRPALALWRRATERPRASANPAEDVGVLAGGSMGPRFDAFNWLALLEGSRLEEAGDLAGAWGWYNAALRASRHVGMKAGSERRMLGLAMFESVADRIGSWCRDPRVDGPTLRRALADLRAADAMTGPNSDAVRADYVALTWAYRHPEAWEPRLANGHWLAEPYPRADAAWRWFRREPERSERVLRLILARWLAHVDRPPAARPPLAQPVEVKSRWLGTHSYPDFPYAAGPGEMRPEALFGWMQSSRYAGTLVPTLKWSVPALDGERSSRAVLMVTLAEQAFEREQGRPPRSARELVDRGYLDALPPAYADSSEEDATP